MSIEIIKGMPDWTVPINANFAELEADKTNILSQIGTENLTTNAQNLKGAVNEVNEQMSDMENDLRNNTNYVGGVVTFIDDDSPDVFFTRWKPIADTCGIKISEAVNTSFIGNSGYMTLAQLKQLKSEGYDILSHGYTHPNLNTMSLTDIENEWNLSRQFLIDNGLGDNLALVYPTGLYSITDKTKIITVKALTRKYFKYGIDANSGVNAFANVLAVDSYEVNRVFIDPSTVTLATIKTYIDDAFANGKWLIFLTHCGIAWDNANSPTNFTAIINYIKGLSMPILNFSEAEKLVGNAISQGDIRTNNYNFVSRNGGTLNSNPTKYSALMTVSSMNAPITEYTKYKRTTMQIASDQDTFLHGGGIMEVYRGDSAYSYAIFYPAMNTVAYKRYYIDGTSTWGDWTMIGDSIPISRAMTVSSMDAPITEYTKYKVTTMQIAGNQDTHTYGEGGVMTVYRGDSAYSYALFYPAMNTTVYKRYYMDGTSTWGNWVVVGTGQGTTANRPTIVGVGYNYFDTTLSKPIWWSGTVWKDATGTTV